MNTKDLMIHVERIVRPIHADPPRKLRMRRELLAHLEAAVEEQRARGLDEEAALAEAKRRLGNSAELSRDLQATVPRLERLGSTPFSISSAWLLLFVCLLVPAVVAIAGFKYIPPHRWAILLAAIVILELNCFLWYRFCVGIYRLRVRWPRRVWLGVAALVVQPAWISLLGYAGTGRFTPDNSGQAVLAQFLLPMFFVPATLVDILLQRRSTEWLDLNIAN